MTDRTVPCPSCDRMFKDENGLAQHLADVHKQGKRPRRSERYPLFIGDGDPDVIAEYTRYTGI